MTDDLKTGPDEAADIYRAVLENTSTGLHIYRLENEADDRSLRMVFVNPAGAELVGMKAEDMTGRLILDIFPALEADGIHARYAAVVREKKGFRVGEYFYRHPGKPGAWYSFNAFPLPGARMGVLFEDISALKEVAGRLAVFVKLAENSSDAIFVVEPETGAFLDVNDTACKKLGYPRETLLRMCVGDIQAIVPTPERWRALSAKVASAGALVVEGAHKRADGTAFPVEVSISRTEIDGKAYFLANARDITERRKMEEALNEVSALRVLIPICAQCKKVRDDKGFWHQVENYMEKHSAARFTHGLCEDCQKEIYGKEAWFKEKKKPKADGA